MNTSCPVITLNNGIRIANWSSPHPFTFVTGEVLPACEHERVKSMSLDIDENIINNERWEDIEMSVSVPEEVYEDLQKLQYNDEIDIILVPFMVLDALKNSYSTLYGSLSTDKCRVIRVADRITKTIYSNKFCI